MPKRTYRPEERTAALELYRTDGPRAAAAATGIPVGTIASWAARNGVQTHCNETRAAAVQATRLRWEERRLDMVHRMGDIAAKALERVEHAIDGQAVAEDGTLEELIVADARRQSGQRMVDATDAKNFATTMAILVDKAQLLSGAATGRTEHLDARTRRDQLRDELAAKRAERANAA